MFNEKNWKKRDYSALRIFFLISFMTGTLNSAKMACAIGEIGMGIMTWLNLIAVFLLRKPILLSLKDFEAQKAVGEDPIFNPTSN
ncbi:alanine:cation symporter family protein [Peribacillus sp. NPDC006672]|uniref:alanine:cation symporter family protein n=1 Tax=Peribacillus sp. NPDC006672 TaxID=3390606 RepID=UPI003D01A821